jgi:hypothetical protein
VFDRNGSNRIIVRIARLGTKWLGKYLMGQVMRVILGKVPLEIPQNWPMERLPCLPLMNAMSGARP